MTRTLVFAAVAALLFAACGGATADTGADAASDAPADGRRAIDDSATADGSMDDAPALDASTVDGALMRCPGSTYTSAPAGGACDPARIEYIHVRGTSCSGPTAGTYCDTFQVSVSVADARNLPSGFRCGSPELGVVTCRWVFGDGGGGTLDDAAIGGACAATASNSKLTVECIVYD